MYRCSLLRIGSLLGRRDKEGLMESKVSTVMLS